MSGDKEQELTVTVSRRKVERNPFDKLYYVMECNLIENENGSLVGWKSVSKGYPHSTSAYACLGRLTNADSKLES